MLAALALAAALAPAFSPHITNRYFPAKPGMRWVYRGVDGGHRLREVVRVTRHVEIVDGAPRAGIFMPAHPRIGRAFAQEHFPGHAEDQFRIVGRRGRVLLTREWTPLEPGVREYKRYRPGVGLVQERGPAEHADLVSWKP